MNKDRDKILENISELGYEPNKVKLFINYVKIFNTFSKYIKIQSIKFASERVVELLLKYNLNNFNTESLVNIKYYIDMFKENPDLTRIWMDNIKLKDTDTERYWYISLVDGNKYLEDRQLVENLHKHFLKILDLD